MQQKLETMELTRGMNIVAGQRVRTFVLSVFVLGTRRGGHNRHPVIKDDDDVNPFKDNMLASLENCPASEMT